MKRIYLVLVQSDAGALPLHAFASAEDAARFINEKSAAARSLGATFRLTDMVVNGEPPEEEEEGQASREAEDGYGWLDSRLRYSLGKEASRFGHTDFANYSWRQMSEGPKGGGRHAFLTYLRGRPAIFGCNPSIRARVDYCLKTIERGA